MSYSRERRESIIEENKAQKRKELDDLFDKYRSQLEKVGNVIVAHITSLADDKECSEECEDCCECNHRDGSADFLRSMVLDPIKEVTDRWSNDPSYDSDDALDTICNILEKFYMEEL